MRPVAKSNSAFKSPLNEILGYQGNVRILRCMAVRSVAMSYSGLAEQTGISIPGVHKAVNRLIETGILTYQGSGKRQLVELREEHPLYDAITNLFSAEKNRVDSLMKKLKTEMGVLDPQPSAAWIYGNVAQKTDRYGDPLQIALFANVKYIGRITDQFRHQIMELDIESTFDVTIEIRGITQADLDESHKTIEGGYTMLWGMDPIYFAEGVREDAGRYTTHEELDARSLEAGKAWAKFIKSYPEIIPRTVRHLDQQISETDSGVRKELIEWKQFLESASLQRLVKLLESDSERAVRLRQSNPFWQIVTKEEREKLQKIINTIHESRTA